MPERSQIKLIEKFAFKNKQKMMKTGNEANNDDDDDEDDDVNGHRENKKPTQKHVLLSRDVLTNYVSKLKDYNRPKLDKSIEDVQRNVGSRDDSKDVRKVLSRDVLKNYVSRNANTFRMNSKKNVVNLEDNDDETYDEDDEYEWTDEDETDDEYEDNDQNDLDNDDDDNDNEDNLDFLIIDGFSYQLSKYSASIKLKEVLLGKQCNK